jgi:hypothetical protein
MPKSNAIFKALKETSLEQRDIPIAQGWRKDQLGRVIKSDGLRLKRSQHHPQNREENDKSQ